MGLISRLAAAVRGPAAAPQASGGGVTLKDQSSLRELLRAESDGVSSPERAMRVATVYRCVSLIAEGVAGAELGIRRNVGGEYLVIHDDPLGRLLRRRPNSWQSGFEFFQLLTAHALLRGDGFAYIVRRPGSGVITDLWPLDPTRVVVEQLADQRVRYTLNREDGRTREVSPKNMLHVRNLSVDGVTGISVVERARHALGVSIAAESYSAATWKNGAKPSGALKTEQTLSDLAYERLKKQIADQSGEKAGSTLILEDGLSFDYMAMKPTDAQFIETRKFTDGDIARFFGVPPLLLGDTEKNTSFGAGIEQQLIAYVRFTLSPWLDRWSSAINRSLIAADDDREAFFDERGLMRGDSAARSRFHTAMLQWGVMSPDEVRRAEGYGPRPDGAGETFYDPPNTAGTPAQSEAER